MSLSNLVNKITPITGTIKFDAQKSIVYGFIYKKLWIISIRFKYEQMVWFIWVFRIINWIYTLRLDLCVRATIVVELLG